MDIQKLNNLTVKAYAKVASKYHALFHDELAKKEFDRSVLDDFSKLLPNNARVCDAGCGPSAHYTHYLYNKGFETVGIDISEDCISIAHENYPEMAFHVMDMRKTSFPDNYFDGIIAVYATIHTPKCFQSEIFREFNRILKPGGKILVVVKKGTEEAIIHDEWYEGESIYFTHFTENEIVDYLSESGFTISFLKTREPYEFELPVERIYAVGKKNN